MGSNERITRGRRKALQSIASASVTTLGLSNTVFASETGVRSKPDTSFCRGFTYNPTTMEILGEASGYVETEGSAISADITLESDSTSLSSEDFSVQSQEPTKIHRQSNRELQHFEEYRRKDTRPLEKISVVYAEPGITGCISTPSTDATAFALQRAGTRCNLSDFIESLQPKKRRSIESSSSPSEKSASDEIQQTDRIQNVSSGDYKHINWRLKEDTGNDADSDGWKWITYLTADNSDTRYSHLTLPRGEFNRWRLQSYFIREPAPDPSSGYITSIDSTYYITCTPNKDENSEDPDIEFSAQRPNEYDSSDYEFSVGIGASFGMGHVTMGPSISVGLDAGNTDFAYPASHSTWYLDMYSFPDDQENNRGVKFNTHVSTSDDEKDFQWRVSHNWTYNGGGSGCDPGLIYARASMDDKFDIPVVDV